MKTAVNNFLDIEKIPLEKAQIIVAPFSFEATTTYGRGTKNGPKAIISASSQVELFDEELWQETDKKIKIATLEELKLPKDILKTKGLVEKLIGDILKQKKFPISLGGEHSLTPFIIGAYQKSGFKNFSILQFDAHADLRDGYENQKYSHAAAMRRCLDFSDINLVQMGIRNISNTDNELDFWENNQKRIKTFWIKDKKTWEIGKIIKNLKDQVYLTFDVDAFDSSLMPSTGTPEPGGLFWQETLDILRQVCKEKKIIGADFMELSPLKNFIAPDFLVAKLIYKFIGYLKNI